MLYSDFVGQGDLNALSACDFMVNVSWFTNGSVFVVILNNSLGNGPWDGK